MKGNMSPVGNSFDDIQEIRALLAETYGKFFSVVFVKRGDGTERRMKARLMALAAETFYRDKLHHQWTVWDVQAGGWRVIPLERVVRLRASGQEWLTKVGD